MFSIILSLNLSNLSAREIPDTKDSSSNPTIIEHTPIPEFTYGESLEIVAVVKEEVEWLGFFYRPEGLESFQVRKMERISESSYSYVLDTSTLVSAKFDYYLGAQFKEKMIYVPEQAPEEFFEVLGKVEEPLPPARVEREVPPKEKKFKLPLSITVNGSIGHTLKEEIVLVGEEKTRVDGNIGLSRLYQKGNFQFNFDSNSSYSSHPLEGDQNLYLTDLTLSLSGKNHTLRIGDVSISESKFTISGLTRRGLGYTFDDEHLYFHIFDISPQQERGWGRFIPKPDLSFYGGALGYSFFDEKFSLKGVYLAGRDDPTQGKNVAGSFLTSTEGNGIALIPEVKFFQDKLHLIGELAQSSYDDNLEDEEGKKKDRAWSLGSTISYGVFKLGGIYKWIGKDFNSVGNQFDSLFTNDRKGYDASLQLSLGRIGLNLSYKNEEDNVNKDPTYLTSYDESGNATLSWDVSDKFSLSLGYGESKQETFSDQNREILFQDSLTKDSSLGLNFLISPQASVNLSVINSDLSSTTDSSRDSSTVTANLGGSLRLGKILFLSPNLSYSSSRSEVVPIETKTYNSFLSGELAIIPELLSISISGSFTRTEAGPENTTTDYTNISASLNWYVKGRMLGLANSLLSLRWDLEQTENEGSSDESERFMLEFNFSF
jgi:predicted porin